ncbi:caspase family protein [Emticicia sp. SJ17W-69]|uniref:caspase family protein n=1 Tax=Emticicia sp. SJ17W-69 TaxID=3421657 RepID=UPI003EBB104D
MNSFYFNIYLLLITLTINAQPSQSYAVIVGISDYKILTNKSGDLIYAKYDALKFLQFLKTPKGGNIPASNIIFLSNSDATKAKIMTSLNLFRKAHKNDKVIFYFSGHGIDKGFVPYDVSATNSNSILWHDEIKNAFKDCDASIKICFADACLSGSMKTLSNTTKSDDKSVDKNDSNVAMILSSRSSQNSLESNATKGGVFTYFLLKGLNGGADKNSNYIVTIRELYTYMSPRIQKSTPNAQSPVFYGKFSNDLPMSYL